MAAKKTPESKISPFVLAAMRTAERVIGKERCYVAADHEKRQTGIPIPALAMRYLADSSVWPLQRITLSGGAQSTFKSAFIFELERWFLDAGGVVAHVDTENKTSSSFMYSIIPEKYFTDDDFKMRLQFANCATINDWQQVITGYVTTAREHVKDYKKRPDEPLLIAVDSLMGSGSEESKEHIASEGEAQGRGYSDAPILISQFLRDLSTGLIGLPITIHASNHEKPDISGKGVRRAGGSAPDFYASLDLRFQKGNRTGETYGSGEVSRRNLEGRTITMTVRKSSIGPDNRQIAVPFYWTYDAEQGNKQVSWWDWNAATAQLLFLNKSQLKDAFEIASVRKDRVGDVYWSRDLGITEKDPASGSDFGKLIETNPEVLARVEAALKIQKHQPYAPGVLDT